MRGVANGRGFVWPNQTVKVGQMRVAESAQVRPLVARRNQVAQHPVDDFAGQAEPPPLRVPCDKFRQGNRPDQAKLW